MLVRGRVGKQTAEAARECRVAAARTTSLVAVSLLDSRPFLTPASQRVLMGEPARLTTPVQPFMASNHSSRPLGNAEAAERAQGRQRAGHGGGSISDRRAYSNAARTNQPRQPVESLSTACRQPIDSLSRAYRRPIESLSRAYRQPIESLSRTLSIAASLLHALDAVPPLFALLCPARAEPRSSPLRLVGHRERRCATLCDGVPEFIASTRSESRVPERVVDVKADVAVEECLGQRKARSKLVPAEQGRIRYGMKCLKK